MFAWPVHFRSFTATLLAAAAFGCAGTVSASAAAADLPPAPTDRVADDTRALSESERAAIASQLAQFRHDHGYDVWIVATTFLSTDLNVRQHARDLRRFWSGDQPAMVLAYDRSSNLSSLSIAPSLWDRYSAARLVLLTQQTAALMHDAQKPLNERVTAAGALLVKTLRLLEKHQTQLADPLPAAHSRLASRFGPLLAIGAFAVAILLGWVRRRDVLTTWQLLFPAVQVGTRFGAPFGGGVSVEWPPAPMLPGTRQPGQLD